MNTRSKLTRTLPPSLAFIIAITLCSSNFRAFAGDPPQQSLTHANYIDPKSGDIKAGTPAEIILQDFGPPDVIIDSTFKDQFAQVWSYAQSFTQIEQVVICNGAVVHPDADAHHCYGGPSHAEHIDRDVGVIVVGTPASFVLREFGTPQFKTTIIFNRKPTETWGIRLPSGQIERVTVANGLVAYASFEPMQPSAQNLAMPIASR